MSQVSVTAARDPSGHPLALSSSYCLPGQRLNTTEAPVYRAAPYASRSVRHNHSRSGTGPLTGKPVYLVLNYSYGYLPRNSTIEVLSACSLA
jgi:hypothetical protein